MSGRMTTIVTVAVLAICVSAAVIGNFIEQKESAPEKGASVEGVWHQTMTSGYYEGAKINQTYEANDLTIHEYTDYKDQQHFLRCSQRGSMFTAFRSGDRIIWNYATESAMYLAIADCYGQCMVVNEFCITDGQREQIYVNSSVYTKNNSIPSWINERTYSLPDKKWVLNDAIAISDMDTADLGGKSLYLLENYGPVFKAEMEQSVGTTISTKKLTGAILDQDTSGNMFSIAIDDTQIIWFMKFTEDSVVMSCVSISDFAAIDGMVSVMRRYIGVFDSTFPPMEKPVIRAGMEYELKGATYFTSDTIADLPMEGTVTVGMIYYSVLVATATFTDSEGSYNANIYGFTLPTEVEDQYFFYCYYEGSLCCMLDYFGGGFGHYDASTKSLTIDLQNPAGDDSPIIELTLQLSA